MGGLEVGQARRRSAWEAFHDPKEIEFFGGKFGGSFIQGWPCGLQKLEDRVFRSPPEWNEYIPKKNRHSKDVLKDANVNRHEPTHATHLGGGEIFYS